MPPIYVISTLLFAACNPSTVASYLAALRVSRGKIFEGQGPEGPDVFAEAMFSSDAVLMTPGPPTKTYVGLAGLKEFVAQIPPGNDGN